MATCPNCGALIAHALGSAFDDDPTPVDLRIESYAEGNARLLEAELVRHKAEEVRVGAELEIAKGRILELEGMEVENTALRLEVQRLRLALAGRNRKT